MPERRRYDTWSKTPASVALPHPLPPSNTASTLTCLPHDIQRWAYYEPCVKHDQTKRHWQHVIAAAPLEEVADGL